MLACFGDQLILDYFLHSRQRTDILTGDVNNEVWSIDNENPKSPHFFPSLPPVRTNI